MEFTAWPKSAESSGRLFGCTVCTALFALTTVICLVFVGVVLLRNTTAIDTIARVREVAERQEQLSVSNGSWQSGARDVAGKVLRALDGGK